MIIFNLVNAHSYAKESINDYLYSSEYFDYLIECAEIEKEKEEFCDSLLQVLKPDIDFKYIWEDEKTKQIK